MQHDDREFILAEEWPYWPLLPVKRYTNNDLECATLLAPSILCLAEEGFRVVYCMFPEYTAEIASTRYTDYADVDAILADGWLVD